MKPLTAGATCLVSTLAVPPSIWKTRRRLINGHQTESGRHGNWFLVIGGGNGLVIRLH